MLIRGDARAIPLKDKSVHMVLTSPPYWSLRDYGAPGQLGLERTPEEYIASMVAVFREVYRVLRDDGTLWLNMGDSYAGNRSYQVPDSKHRDVGNTRGMTVSRRRDNSPVPRSDNLIPGLKAKDLVGMPWRLAFALQAAGWYLRKDIIWEKPNPMPESVTDRPTSAHEYLFLLAKREKYFYDAEAVREPDAGTDHPRRVLDGQPSLEPSGGLLPRHRGIRTVEGRNGTGRNRRSVWTIATEPYGGAHFATFPQALAEPCILAGTSEKGCCPACMVPWKRVTSNRYVRSPQHGEGSTMRRREGTGRRDATPMPRLAKVVDMLGWVPTCACDAGAPIPAIVFDPFCGSGTTQLVASRLGRLGVGLDLTYQPLAADRLVGPLFRKIVNTEGLR